jgi:NDP-sugar pyrophosphorylase family protein
MKALILAAGLGKRLRPYSQHTPKALFTINERPVLAMAIEKLQKAGFDAVIINTHHHHQLIETFIAQTNFVIPVQTRHEVDILGTGGAIRNVADFWENDNLLVINADIVSDIDLAEVYGFHNANPHPVTMVMHDYAQFNGVDVDANDFITGFYGKNRPPESRKLAFTGIHVLDRRILDFLPPRGPAHVIETYQKMIQAGERIKAKVARGHRWYDIGTPKSYQAAVYDHMAPLAFETASGRRPGGTIQKLILQGDGSDRHWYRLKHEAQSIIMVDHGIRSHPHTQEVDAYVDIGRHLAIHQVAVPRIYLYDRHAGLVFTQDLGDTHLQSVINADDPDHTRRRYEAVIDQWILMAVAASRGFDTKWTWQTPCYDTQVILNNECRYFTEAFVQGYLQWEISYEELQTECRQLAEGIRATEVRGFIHRDFQSRNIILQNDQPHIIDYQGGRLGPIQYDLASLLIDPYANLPEPLQSQLLSYAIEKVQHCIDIDPDRFRTGFRLCAISRNLQVLGAYAFLSQIKGKKQFEQYIPRAAISLGRNLSCLKGLSLPKLEILAANIIDEITRKTGPKGLGKK